MTEYLTLGSAIDGILAHEPCDGKDEALIVLGLRALLAAIGVVPEYRQHYIAKGGTLLRLLSPEPIGRLSTDLDFSGLELPVIGIQGHKDFAVNWSPSYADTAYRL